MSKLEEPGLDYPTAWAMQKAGLIHTDEQCSAAQTNGAFLCDCDAIWLRWRELEKPKTPQGVRDAIARESEEAGIDAWEDEGGA
jgi:hypothetical protein